MRVKLSILKLEKHIKNKQKSSNSWKSLYENKLSIWSISQEKRKEISKKAYINGLGKQSKKTLSQNGIRGRRKFVEENSKRVTFISPDGTEYFNQILAYFCKEHNLDYAAMRYIAKKNGKARPHKGGSARYPTLDH